MFSMAPCIKCMLPPRCDLMSFYPMSSLLARQPHVAEGSYVVWTCHEIPLPILRPFPHDDNNSRKKQPREEAECASFSPAWPKRSQFLSRRWISEELISRRHWISAKRKGHTKPPSELWSHQKEEGARCKIATLSSVMTKTTFRTYLMEIWARTIHPELRWNVSSIQILLEELLSARTSLSKNLPSTSLPAKLGQYWGEIGHRRDKLKEFAGRAQTGDLFPCDKEEAAAERLLSFLLRVDSGVCQLPSAEVIRHILVHKADTQSCSSVSISFDDVALSVTEMTKQVQWYLLVYEQTKLQCSPLHGLQVCAAEKHNFP